MLLPRAQLLVQQDDCHLFATVWAQQTYSRYSGGNAQVHSCRNHMMADATHMVVYALLTALCCLLHPQCWQVTIRSHQRFSELCAQLLAAHVQVAHDIATALQGCANEWIAHGDLSPANFGFIDGRGRLFDFSAAKVSPSCHCSRAARQPTWFPVHVIIEAQLTRCHAVTGFRLPPSVCKPLARPCLP